MCQVLFTGWKAKLSKGCPRHQGDGIPTGQELTSFAALPTPDQLYKDLGGMQTPVLF